MQSLFRKTMKSGDLAKQTGVSADTLHHYEKLGLLSPASRQDNGYREYDADSIQRVKLIQNALRLGFTLRELAPILHDRDKGEKPCDSVRRLAATKLQEIDDRLIELQALRSEFEQMLKDWDRQLGATPKDKQARLLERVSETKTASTRSKKRPGRSLS